MLLREKHTFLFFWNFCFERTVITKNTTNKTTKNHEERKPKSLEDRAIRTIELQDM